MLGCLKFFKRNQRRLTLDSIHHKRNSLWSSRWTILRPRRREPCSLRRHSFHKSHRLQYIFRAVSGLQAFECSLTIRLSYSYTNRLIILVRILNAIDIYFSFQGWVYSAFTCSNTNLLLSSILYTRTITQPIHLNTQPNRWICHPSSSFSNHPTHPLQPSASPLYLHINYQQLNLNQTLSPLNHAPFYNQYPRPHVHRQEPPSVRWIQSI